MCGALSRPQLPSTERLTPPIRHEALQDLLGSRETLNKKASWEKEETRYWLSALEEWSPTKICLMSGETQVPTPQVLFRERLWIALCERVVRNLEAELDMESWLCNRLPMFQRICEVSTLREFWIARQEGTLGLGDKDWIDQAPYEYEALLEHLAHVDLADDFAFLQPGADTHQRLVRYHMRVAASHRALVRRVRGELGSATEPA